MTAKQWKRLDVVERVGKGELTAKQAAVLLKTSLRNFRRIRRRVEAAGRDGVVHGNTARSAWNRIAEDVRELVLKLARTRYVGFNDHHLTEKLVEVEGVEISRQSVQRILREAGDVAVRRRRPRKHRRRRDRKAQAGMMLLWDGSRHDWLEDRGPRFTLVGAIDDATGEVMPGAHFVDQECAAAYLKILREVARAKGLPFSIYMDRHGSLKRNDKLATVEEELDGKAIPTQVGRALETLGIEPIFALSPQAKGRVERLWGTFQDRLVSELRLAKVTDIDGANELLEKFIPDFNRRFGVRPSEKTSAWRRAPCGVDLELICAFRYEVVVGNDNAVRLAKTVIDIPPGPKARSYAKAAVTVFQLLSGEWQVFHQGKKIATAASTNVGELRVAVGYSRAYPGRKSTRSERHGYTNYVV